MMSRYIDTLTPLFGKIRVVFAEENGKSVGRIPGEKRDE